MLSHKACTYTLLHACFVRVLLHMRANLSSTMGLAKSMHSLTCLRIHLASSRIQAQKSPKLQQQLRAMHEPSLRAAWHAAPAYSSVFGGMAKIQSAMLWACACVTCG